jgi:CAAX protease family protein
MGRQCTDLGTIPRVLDGRVVALRIVGAILAYLVGSVMLTGPLLLVVFLRPDLAAGVVDSPLREASLVVPTTGGIVAVLLYTRRVDGRPIRTLGLEPAGVAGRWLRGAAIAALMMGFVVLVWYTLLDGANWTVNADLPRAGLSLTLGLLAFVVQGPSEEILFRGYILQIVTARWDLRWGIGVSAVLFAVLHGLNASFGLLPFINLLLFGAATAAYKMLLDDDQLWGVFGIHTIWNWLQQMVFGLENSGSASPIADTLFHVEPNRALPDPIWGGGFGPEGTLATTLVLLALLARVLLHVRRQADRDSSVLSVTGERSV